MHSVPISDVLDHSGLYPVSDDVTASLARAAEMDGLPCHAFRSTGLADVLRDDDLDAAAHDMALDAAPDEPPACEFCGDESSGMTIAGVHLPVCDRCMIAELVGRVGCGHVRDVVSSIGASFAA